MILNYLKVAIRYIIKQKGYSIINLLGLAIGLACSMLIILYIQYELSFDTYHSKSEQIYRVAVKGHIADDFLNVAVSNSAFLPAAIRDFPSVETGVRFNPSNELFLSYNDNSKYYEQDLCYADSMLFDVFDFDILLGNPKTALTEPFSMVLTKSLSDKYFGSENPIGKVLRVNGDNNYKITAVIADIPHNTHFNFTGFISFNTLYKFIPKEYLDDNWGSLSYYTYILVNKNSNVDELNESFPEYSYLKMKEYMGEIVDSADFEFTPYLQALEDIHLHSNLMSEISDNSSILYIYIFGAIAVFILLIACINFMNLSTARAQRRAKEVGVRKVSGALRKHLILQYIGESLIISFFSLIIGLVIVELSLPIFNNFLDTHLSLNIITDYQILLCFIGMAAITGLISGSYPAFYLSAFQPAIVLKGAINKKKGNFTIRNFLVVFQFAVSIFLIISTIIVYKQLSFIQNKDMGFDKDNVIAITLKGEKMQGKWEYYKNELLQMQNVLSVGATSSNLGQDLNGQGFLPEGFDDNKLWLIYTFNVDYDYISSMGFEIVNGRNFSKEYGTDSLGILVNETLVKKLGWKDPIGKKIRSSIDSSEVSYSIIGVVRDFHFKSLESVIEPMLIRLDTKDLRYLNVKINDGNVAENIAALEKEWNAFETEFPFDFFFLDQRLQSMYSSEKKLGGIFIYFTILAIFIACLGLFGLASYISELRTKEIGIRKTLGASVYQLTFLLAKEFTKWVIVANIIAWPIAYFLMKDWLENFAYATNIPLWVFIVAAVISFLIAFLTVIYQALKASLRNPAISLKYE